LLGFSEEETSVFDTDIELLRSAGIKPFILPRLLDNVHKLGFAEMALLKITPWSFAEYDRIQFFDGDVMPTKNMDCFFQLELNTFTVGMVSPLNSGWYMAIPNNEDYLKLKEKAVWRLGRDWDTVNGWEEPMIPKALTYRGGKKYVEEWLFNGADMDQGLLTHYFIINEGRSILIDTDLKKGKVFNKGIKSENAMVKPMSDLLKCCQGQIPTSFFSHFTGRSKPWMNENLPKTTHSGGNGDLYKWKTHLDELKLEGINSTSIINLKLGSPLGFFNSNFPKGGYKSKKSAE